MESKAQFFLECYRYEVVKFGQFTLKSGLLSPFYVDLRPLASDPQILKKLSSFLLKLVDTEHFDLICGVPYAALPMATVMSLDSNLPLIIKRKEAKSYGTKKLIEGIYKKGDHCLLVEDVITSGKSLLETISELEKEDLKVTDIIVVLDREQGGKQLLESKGYHVHTLFSISEVCDILSKVGQLEHGEILRIHDFLSGNMMVSETKKKTPYLEKSKIVEHPLAKKLLHLACDKKSNLIASADVTTTQELLDFATKVGPHIVALKTHIDIIVDFSFENTILPLKKIAEQHHFLLMEDRKFADIGNTQELQFVDGAHQISRWADFITAHMIGGYHSLDCFSNVGVVAILGMSSKGALTSHSYREEALEIALSHPNVMGGVSQNTIPEELLLFTPGVNLQSTGDDKGQQYNTPEHVFSSLHTDFIIVGRGIYQAECIESAAISYKITGWDAYEKSLI